MESQSEDDKFDINACSYDESIIGRMHDNKKDIRVRMKIMTVIENLSKSTQSFSFSVVTKHAISITGKG